MCKGCACVRVEDEVLEAMWEVYRWGRRRRAKKCTDTSTLSMSRSATGDKMVNRGQKVRLERKVQYNVRMRTNKFSVPGSRIDIASV